ncbi:MAG: hypothetical protein HQL37_01585 [Alphaproteobacteria bacterium]|nr:hypothetical protein [Alphaproteobacteria bacterium]
MVNPDPMQTEPPPPPNYFVETGAPGLRSFGGYVRDDFVPQLYGRNAILVYREMADNNASVGAALFAIKQIIRSLECRVEPADGVPGGEAAAVFVASLKDDMMNSWDGFLTEVLTMMEYGFAPIEVVYKRRRGHASDPLTASRHTDGLIGVAKLGLRAQDTLVKWLMDSNGNLFGMTQQPWNAPMVDIPIEKLLLFRTSEEKNNPQGRSVLRSAWRAWYCLKRIEEIEAIGIERDLAGLPVVKVPSSLIQAANGSDPVVAASAVQTLNAYKAMVRNIRRDEQEGVVLPSDRDEQGHLQYELSLLSTGGTRQFDTSAIVTRYKQDILSTMLADFVMMGQTARGTQALAETKVDMFLTAVQGFVTLIAAVLNRQLLPRLWRLNGFDPRTLPKFSFDKAQRPNLGAMGDFLQKAAAAGLPLFPDLETETYIRDFAGLPPPPAGRAAGGPAGGKGKEAARD